MPKPNFFKKKPLNKNPVPRKKSIKKLAQVAKTKNEMLVQEFKNYKPKNFHILNEILPSTNSKNRQGHLASESESFKVSQMRIPVQISHNMLAK